MKIMPVRCLRRQLLVMAVLMWSGCICYNGCGQRMRGCINLPPQGFGEGGRVTALERNRNAYSMFKRIEQWC